MGGVGIFTEIVMNMYTLLCLKYKPTRAYCVAQGMLLSVIGSLDGSEFGGEWIHGYVWLIPFAVHLKLSHCYLAVLQHMIESFKI